MNISKKFTIATAHRLPHHSGKCFNPHGHNYDLIITIAGDIQKENESNSESGMIVDFGELKIIKKWLDDNWDHSYLYKKGDEVGEFLKSRGYRVFEFDFSPTAENMAKYLFEIIKNNFFSNILKVEVFETEGSGASYEG